jgi:hypothetical protein
LVPKSNEFFGAVVDFRSFNKLISVESVRLLDLHATFDCCTDAKIFTTLDLNQAYHQITAFRLAAFAQVLTRLLDRVLQDIKFEFVCQYLVDVVIYNPNFDERVVYVRLVLDRLREAGLTVKPQILYTLIWKFIS